MALVVLGILLIASRSRRGLSKRGLGRDASVILALIARPRVVVGKSCLLGVLGTRLRGMSL